MPPGQPGTGAAKPAAATGLNIKLTKEQQNNLAAAVLVSALAIFAYVRYWAMPVMKNYREKTAVLLQKKKDLRDAREMVSRYSEFLARASEINRKVDFINKRLPGQINIADTIRDITKSATESNIDVVNFQPGREVNKGSYKEFPIVINFASNYTELGNFLSRVGYIERLTIPSAVSAQRTENTAQDGSVARSKNLAVSMTIKIYSLSE